MSYLLQSKRASVLTALATQNATLKVCLIVSGSFSATLLIALLIVSLKSPMVVGMTASGPATLQLIEDSQILTAQEAKAFIFDLVQKKYPKQPTPENLKNVCRYFTEGPRAACEKELKTKKLFIPQDIIIEEMTWNDRLNIAIVRIKRFANFSGTISSVEGNVSIELNRRFRTADNPWGLFVQSWKEEVRQ